jgi:hypothetical protein
MMLGSSGDVMVSKVEGLGSTKYGCGVTNAEFIMYIQVDRWVCW